MSAQPPLPVLLTRPRAQSVAFAKSLPPGMSAIISPLLEIAPRSGFDKAEQTATLIFTSSNGVDSYAAQHPAGGQAALCVGAKTAERAQGAGFAATSVDGTADDVVATALTLAGPFTHVRGAHARGEIAQRLRSAGHEVTEIIAYDQVAQTLTDDAQELLQTSCLVPLFSPRTAELFVRQCPSAPKARVLCLSAAVKNPLEKGRFESVEIVPKPTAECMKSALSAHAAGINLEGRRTSG